MEMQSAIPVLPDWHYRDVINCWLIVPLICDSQLWMAQRVAGPPSLLPEQSPVLICLDRERFPLPLPINTSLQSGLAITRHNHPTPDPVAISLNCYSLVKPCPFELCLPTHNALYLLHVPVFIEYAH